MIDGRIMSLFFLPLYSYPMVISLVYVYIQLTTDGLQPSGIYKSGVLYILKFIASITPIINIVFGIFALYRMLKSIELHDPSCRNCPLFKDGQFNKEE